jgi:hypothetical protein
MSSRADRPLVYYACGGGLGHVTRAAAILRQLRRRGDWPLMVLTNARRPLPLDSEGLPYHHLAAPDAPALAAQVQAAVKELRPRLLVVDVFAEGLVGELAEVLGGLDAPAVLVYRHVREEGLAEWEGALRHYRVALLAETPVRTLPCPTVECGAMLLRDAEELLTSAEARAALGVTGEGPVVLGVSTEGEEWTRDFFRVLRKATARACPEAELRLACARARQLAGREAWGTTRC